MKLLAFRVRQAATLVLTIVFYIWATVIFVVDRAGQIQAAAAAPDTPALVLNALLAVPFEIPLIAGTVSLAVLLWSIIKDAGQGRAALTTVKSATDKAWAFQGDYQAFRDRIDGRMISC